MGKELPEKAQSILDLIYAIDREIQLLLEIQKALEDRPELRRLFVRSYFALIEPVVSLFFHSAKEALHIRLLQSGLEFLYDPQSLAELCALHEKEFSISDKGFVTVRDLRSPLQNRVLLAIRTFYRVMGHDYDPRQEPGWNDFKESIPVRHRITHPKVNQEIDVTSEELRKVENGFSWLRNRYSQLTQEIRKQ